LPIISELQYYEGRYKEEDLGMYFGSSIRKIWVHRLSIDDIVWEDED